jgi:hypothetical protein
MKAAIHRIARLFLRQKKQIGKGIRFDIHQIR